MKLIIFYATNTLQYFEVVDHLYCPQLYSTKYYSSDRNYILHAQKCTVLTPLDASQNELKLAINEANYVCSQFFSLIFL